MSRNGARTPTYWDSAAGKAELERLKRAERDARQKLVRDLRTSQSTRAASLAPLAEAKRLATARFEEAAKAYWSADRQLAQADRALRSAVATSDAAIAKLEAELTRSADPRLPAMISQLETAHFDLGALASRTLDYAEVSRRMTAFKEAVAELRALLVSAEEPEPALVRAGGVLGEAVPSWQPVLEGER